MGLILAVLIGAVVVWAGFDSFYIIQPAERGVVLRFGAYHEVVGPGPHLKLPLIDSYQAVNVDQIEKFVHRAQMLTKDENIVDVTVEVQYRIQDPADYLFQDANPPRTLQNSMESALREVIGKSNLDDIITENRSGIALAVQKDTQALVDLYRSGLKVININIQDAKPPEAVQDAFADAIKAREDRERVQNQAQAYANDVVPRARGAAARQLEDAKAYKAKVVAEAEGESKRFLALLAEYKKAPEVTRRRLYLDSMQDVLHGTGKVLLDIKKGNNLTYLPLDRLIGPGAGTTGIDPDVVLRPQQSDPKRVELPTNQNTRGGRGALTRERGRR
jgi:membrane protease subunit HflK